MIAQLAQLEQQLKPVLPQISAKLVGDLLATGASPKALGRVIGRSPSYVQTIANGRNSLSAKQIVDLMRHASASAQNQPVPQNVQEAHDNVSEK
jgi:hypothetical protein